MWLRQKSRPVEDRVGGEWKGHLPDADLGAVIHVVVGDLEEVGRLGCRAGHPRHGEVRRRALVEGPMGETRLHEMENSVIYLQIGASDRSFEDEDLGSSPG